jgi:hypothetical protein
MTQMLVLLLRGHPSEVDLVDRLRVLHAARRYAKDPRLSHAQRQHIEEVWLADDDPPPGQFGAWDGGDAA